MALLAGVLGASADVALELWQQGTVPDVLTVMAPPWGVSFVLVFVPCLLLGLGLSLLPWPSLWPRDAAALAAFVALSAFGLMSWFASRDFGGAWMSTSVVVTVGFALGVAILTTALVLLRAGASLLDRHPAGPRNARGTGRPGRAGRGSGGRAERRGRAGRNLGVAARAGRRSLGSAARRRVDGCRTRRAAGRRARPVAPALESRCVGAWRSRAGSAVHPCC